MLQRCDSICLTCSSLSVCLSCNDGYFLGSNTCNVISIFFILKTCEGFPGLYTDPFDYSICLDLCGDGKLITTYSTF